MPTALVTGSARGIGRAIALRYAADGYDVAINYRSSEKQAQAFAQDIYDKTEVEAIVVQADISDSRQAARLVEETVDHFGGLDHVVNNAGINHHAYTPELSPTDFQRLMEVNVNGTFAVTKAAQPHLLESAVTEGSTIINMSSIVAHTGVAIECHYGASKAGIIGLTRSHAKEFAPDIRVNAIAPGLIETDMTADRTREEQQQEENQIPLARYGTPKEIADAVAYLRDATYITGETLNINGGMEMR